MSSNPVTAMTTFFPIMVCQKANARWVATTLPVLAWSMGRIAVLKLVLFDMPTSLPLLLLTPRTWPVVRNSNQHFLPAAECDLLVSAKRRSTQAADTADNGPDS